ncbi:MAG: PAS domain S-box protein [Chloroflexi bacterium]|nr:PAS domain S-box protein [Chloroflexota bacterium]
MAIVWGGWRRINRQQVELNKTNAGLSESEERFRHTLDNMMEGCQIIGFDWRYLYVNDATALQGRTTKEYLLGKTMMEAYPGIEETEMFAMLRGCMEARTSSHMENEFAYPDGKRGWFDLSIQAVPKGLFILSVDITKRKHAENALRESEELHRVVVANVTEGIVINRDAKRIFVNKAFLDIHGLSDASQVIGNDIGEFIAPEDREQMVARVLARQRGEPVPMSNENRILRMDGEVRTVHTVAVPISYKGQPSTLALIQDITERKQAEEERSQCAKELEALFNISRSLVQPGTFEEKVTLVLNLLAEVAQVEEVTFSMPDDQEQGMRLVAAIQAESQPQDRVIRHVIPYGQGFWEDVLGRGEPMIINDYPAHRLAAPETIAQGVRSLAILPIKAGDKSLGTVGVSSSKNDHFTPERVGLLAAIVDRMGVLIENALLQAENISEITQRKQAEEESALHAKELEAALQNLQATQQQLTQSEKLVGIGQLVSGVAHELNNPLTGVWGTSQLIMRREIDETLREDLEIIQDEALRAVKIVQNLLSFAREHKFEKSSRSINETLELTLEMRAYVMKVSGIEMEAKLQPDLPDAWFDVHQMQQVFLNIVVNAEQAMSEAHGGGKLLVKTEKVDEKIRISFTDDGPGISKENQARIFDPFFTTKEVGKGTGLGLSICYGIVQDHWGGVAGRERDWQGLNLYNRNTNYDW